MKTRAPSLGRRRRMEARGAAECAAKGGVGTPCTGPAAKRCGLCGAVAYCTADHQVAHWRYHKDECARFGEQMKRVEIVRDFPFTFSKEGSLQVIVQQFQQNTRCSSFMSMGLHQIGLWKHECDCNAAITYGEQPWEYDSWDLPCLSCPCTEPSKILPFKLSSWKEYYAWRDLPLNSPASLLLHWPLTIYLAYQLIENRCQKSEVDSILYIHYLGPERELLQLAVFAELLALIPGVDVHIDLVGPAVPQFRDGEKIRVQSYMCCMDACCICKTSNERQNKVTLRFWKGCYHDRIKDIDTFPHFVFAPNAGIAAEHSWLPTIELIEKMGAPAIFSDYCEEAAYLSANCISSITGCPLTIPIQLNPFRQPLAVEGSALYIPCYSNCFLFGI